jgi:alpha-1,6-mannosyltransferase
VKIVDVTEFYSERGGGIRSHLTIRGHVLCQLGHDHVVIAPGPRDEVSSVASSAPQSRVVRIRGPALPYDPTYHLLAGFDKIRDLVNRERPDVLEAHSPYLATLAILRCGRNAASIRTAFWHADHVGTYVEPAVEWAIGRRTPQVLVKPLLSGYAALLAPFATTFAGGRVQTRRLRAAGVHDVVHSPMGVDVAVFRPSDVKRDREGVLIVGVGRLSFEKRWDVVLEAFARVRGARADRRVSLILYGDGPERRRLEAKAPPGVVFAGFERDRARLANALANADVLVHGCPYETFGLAVAEAVACGLPVVVPDRGGAGESADESCAEFYASLDSESCAAAIERVLARDPAELRTRAHRAAAAVTTVQQHFAQVLAVYERLLGAR